MGLFEKLKKQEEPVMEKKTIEEEPKELTIIDKMVEQIKQFQFDVLEHSNHGEHVQAVDQQFVVLLSGISTCRKTPGIEGNMGFNQLYICKSEEDKEKVKEFLTKMMHVQSLETMERDMLSIVVDHEYQNFYTTWVGKPNFDINQLSERGKENFHACMKMAEPFRPFVQERGFLAWDVNEKIGMLRRMLACGMIDEEQFWKRSYAYAQMVIAKFHSWEEYATSCLCGAAYFALRNYKEDEQVMKFFDLNLQILQILTNETGPWTYFDWYRFKKPAQTQA